LQKGGGGLNAHHHHADQEKTVADFLLGNLEFAPRTVSACNLRCRRKREKEFELLGKKKFSLLNKKLDLSQNPQLNVV
jgi:hypothetical protein